MYVSFRKYKTVKERRKKTTELRSARYICAGEISSRDPSEGSQDRKFRRLLFKDNDKNEIKTYGQKAMSA